jgi:hypothetical protein
MHAELVGSIAEAGRLAIQITDAPKNSAGGLVVDHVCGGRSSGFNCDG